MAILLIISCIPDQNAVITLGIIMTSCTVLITIFGRKFFIVVFWREKNIDTFSQQRRSQKTHDTGGKDLANSNKEGT